MRTKLLFLLLIFVFSHTEVLAQEDLGSSYYAVNTSFYHSEGRLEGENYSFNHAGLDLERNWSKNKLWLSGWSLGYRREELDKKHFGHFINFGVFRKFKIVAGIYIKPSIKLEWGLPSDRLDHTVFHEDGSYTYVYLLRNSDLPKGIGKGFFFWPVVDARVGKTLSIFVFEAGVRAGYPSIVKEEYITPETDFDFKIEKSAVLIPSLVGTIGIKF